MQGKLLEVGKEGYQMLDLCKSAKGRMVNDNVSDKSYFFLRQGNIKSDMILENVVHFIKRKTIGVHFFQCFHYVRKPSPYSVIVTL